MKQTILAGTLLLLAFVYVSWRTNGNTASVRAEKERRFTIFENVLGAGAAGDGATPAGASRNGAPSPYGGGQPVPKSEYQPCLDSFVSVMGRYGITRDNPPVPITSMPKLTYPITTSESFDSPGFMKWVDSVVKVYDPNGLGVNIQLHMSFGVCTADFVSHLNQSPLLTGRIAIFVVPGYKSAAAKTAAKALGTADPSATAYELGGLQP